MNSLIAPLIGYIASALLAISLVVTNDLRFRWLNMFGCLSFIVYGVLIQAFPIILTNSILLFINIFYLVKIYRVKEAFDLLEFDPDNSIIQKFLSYYAKDIESYFPGFRLENKENDIRFVVLRDMVIANIFVAGIDHTGEGIIRINYTVPKYRDYKVGRFIFEKEDKFLLSKGIHQLVYTKVHNKSHEHFLQVMGFEKKQMEGSTGYLKKLSAH
jgi:hypothetical protein